MFASAGFSFICYLLVFFRLRGNITVLDGYKVRFHQRPQARISRTDTGAYMITSGRHDASHLTTVAKQMLWNPIAYIILTIPFTAARFSTFSGSPVPFAVDAFTAAVFVLSGFVNTALFCITHNVLPGRWRQRFGIETMLDGGGSDGSTDRRRNSTWERAGSSGRSGAGRASVILNISVEKQVEIEYDAGNPSGASLKSGPSPCRAYGGRPRSDNDSYHIRHLSLPQPPEKMSGDRSEHELSQPEPLPGESRPSMGI
jgi:hypothetical protein